MTSEQARAAFDAAIDGELDSDAQLEFEAALARDQALQAEFARHRALFATREAWGNADAPVDLLASVQHKLRARSAGRFYRDRFAEQRHLRGFNILVLLSAVLAIAVALWFAYQSGLF